MKTEKIYPNHVIEDAARKAGAQVRCLWEIKGPKDTDIAWMTALAINARVAIVQTYKSGGFEVYTACDTISIPGTIRDALARCGVNQEAQS